MTNWAVKALDSAFGHPRGLLGRIGGSLMARGNARVEEHIVGLAKLGKSDTVLVVGHGPGVGLRAAGAQAAHVIGVDPSADMRELAGERCADLIAEGGVELRHGNAQDTGQPAESVHVVLSVNNVAMWPDRAAGFGELFRVLRPGGTLLVSTHQRALTVSREELAAEVRAAGFTDVQSWVWQPEGTGPLAVQLRAVRPLA